MKPLVIHACGIRVKKLIEQKLILLKGEIRGKHLVLITSMTFLG